MKLEMIYHTPEYHKLVEAIARVCYQSYGKLSPTSHSMIKAIMDKGHLSIASSGNIVFSISRFESMDEISWVLDTILSMKQINNFVRVSTPQQVDNGGSTIKLSMNILTLTDIINNRHTFPHLDSLLLDSILEEVATVPYLNWFIDPSTVIDPSDNPYIPNPTLGSPVILSEDYTALKQLGLNDYELDIHATVTVDLVTDRASGLQMWRHGDMTGGCELSQRYCDRSTAELRPLVDISNYPERLAEYAERNGLTIEEAREHYQAVHQTMDNHLHETIELYSDLIETYKELGVSAKRAKEIARSILPNTITTRIIQCRPLRQWKHFFNLRDSIHAQPEIQVDTQAIKKSFTKAGIIYE
ncbi:FAD-dependent thymidylate synthase (plasmid) [Paenibacillus peoriae]|uniref:FAD-dependent thymidylate synthase n=1 Tax=Paenibacillus peoriae TaxID=59893 RepID=A0A7H0YH97_9BACL|nr:FAD-dependent thymidylate synthase [Paenibacillus peoriae]QNR70455.1 FAD-dependent thymidylate synthase [Paenibacillus peoriae]